MAVDILIPQVFAQAMGNTIVLRNEIELVEDPKSGEPVEVSVQVRAKPGEIIDVSGWAYINAYVDRGEIILLTNEQAQAHLAALQAVVVDPPVDATTKTPAARSGRTKE